MPVLAILTLSAATLCWNDTCVPVLAGKDTPVGNYEMQLRSTTSPGYGGDVLLFKETDKAWFAVHRTWPGREKMYRLPDSQRRAISMGCVNIEPTAYSALRSIATSDSAYLIIKP